MSGNPYLYSHQNAHAPRRENNVRFWGYPSRGTKIRGIGVHTAENLPDLSPPDLGAENVARYFATTERPASAHVNVDSDSTVVCLPDEAVAFAARGYNRAFLHIELCTQAHRWDDLPQGWRSRILQWAANVCGEWCHRYRIPVVRVTKANLDAGQKGLFAHSDVDPERRTDPGRSFPWGEFLTLTQEVAGRLDQERDMTTEQYEALTEKLDEVIQRLTNVEGDVDWMKRHVPSNLADELDEIRRAVRE